MHLNCRYSIMLLVLAVARPPIAASVAVLPDIGGFQNSNYGGAISPSAGIYRECGNGNRSWLL
jgi:hypothetical protein